MPLLFGKWIFFGPDMVRFWLVLFCFELNIPGCVTFGIETSALFKWVLCWAKGLFKFNDRVIVVDVGCVGVADKDIDCVIPVGVFPETRPGLDAALTSEPCWDTWLLKATDKVLVVTDVLDVTLEIFDDCVVGFGRIPR